MFNTVGRMVAFNAEGMGSIPAGDVVLVYGKSVYFLNILHVVH